MARHEADREDLLAEAIALTPRAEWVWRGATVTAGVRRDLGVAIYFDGDPMYQFDASGGLRRSLVDGLLYRTQGETLAQLTRARTVDETRLHRRDLNSEELAAFLDAMSHRLQWFLADIGAGHAIPGRQVPEGEPAEPILAALRRGLEDLHLAPALPTRR